MLERERCRIPLQLCPFIVPPLPCVLWCPARGQWGSSRTSSVPLCAQTKNGRQATRDVSRARPSPPLRNTVEMVWPYTWQEVNVDVNSRRSNTSAALQLQQPDLRWWVCMVQATQVALVQATGTDGISDKLAKCLWHEWMQAMVYISSEFVNSQ